MLTAHKQVLSGQETLTCQPLGGTQPSSSSG